MSLILDALNRSRQDADPVPGLATEHAVTANTDGGWLRYVPWVALLIALGFIAWLVLGRSHSAPEAEAAVADLAATQSPAQTTSAPRLEVSSEGRAAAPPPKTRSKPQPVVAKAMPATVQSAPSAAETQSSQQALAEQMKQAVAGAAAKRVTKPSAKNAPKSDDVAQLYQQRQTKTGQSKAAQPKAATAKRQAKVVAPTPAIDIEKVLRQAEDEVENVRMEEHPAPFVNRLSQSKKDSIPTLMYQRHDYSSSGTQSKVVINGKNLRVGGNAAAGVKVDEILADSVVLTHRGTQFRLRALNSWVNL